MKILLRLQKIAGKPRKGIFGKGTAPVGDPGRLFLADCRIWGIVCQCQLTANGPLMPSNAVENQ